MTGAATSAVTDVLFFSSLSPVSKQQQSLNESLLSHQLLKSLRQNDTTLNALLLHTADITKILYKRYCTMLYYTTTHYYNALYS